MTSEDSDDWALTTEHALAGLPPMQESMLRLAYFGGKRQDQIAQIVGLPGKQVARLIADGMRRLARVLEAPAADEMAEPPLLAIAT